MTKESGQIKMLVDEIKLSSQAQTRGLDQISKAIHQMEEAARTPRRPRKKMQPLPRN